jgi:hypothetical protein
MAQDLSNDQCRSLELLLDEFIWDRDSPPKIIHYSSENGMGDLRARMLTEGLLNVQTRYAAFLDYDDVLMPSAYHWLVERLRLSGKAVAFGRVYSTAYDNLRKERTGRNTIYVYGHSYKEFVGLNHAPIHSFMLDLTQINLDGLTYNDNQRYMEDYYLTLQIFTESNCDWASLKENLFIGDYIHSTDRAHTLAISEDSERSALLKDQDYIKCEGYINRLRRTILS